MGVAGSGKTTVGRRLAGSLGWSFVEADDFHPPANVAKMRAGIPLDDADRWPWLDDIRAWLDDIPGSAVVTCSALRRSYRAVLDRAEPRVRYVHLHGTTEQLGQRLSQRRGHFMPAMMLASQLATLEPLTADEDGVVIGIDQTVAAIVAEIRTRLQLG